MKTIALATLLTLIFITPAFSQTKKEKIQELISISNKSYSKMIDGISTMFDKMPSFNPPTKQDSPTDTTIKPWVENTLKAPDAQPFEDTAKNNKLLRTKAGFKKTMLEVMTDMEKDMVPLYDSAFTEKQINSMLVYNKSSASKKVTNSSMSLFTNGNFMDAMNDTSFRTYVFNPKRKEKLDSLMNLISPKESYKTKKRILQGVTKDMVNSTITSEIKDTAEKREMTHSFDSIMKKQQDDPSFTKQMDDIKQNVELIKEVELDKSLTDAELSYLLTYYSDPETKELKQIETKLTEKMSLKILPKMMEKMKKMMKEVK